MGPNPPPSLSVMGVTSPTQTWEGASNFEAPAVGQPLRTLVSVSVFPFIIGSAHIARQDSRKNRIVKPGGAGKNQTAQQNHESFCITIV